MIVVAATTASWLARSDPRLVLRWLDNAEALRDYAALGDFGDVRFFAALEAHPNHRESLVPLLDRMDDLDGIVWWYWLDDLLPEARTNMRTVRVCTGRNLAAEYALRERATHVLYLDADLTPPPDAIPKLLNVDWPIVGGHVPVYALPEGLMVTNRRRWIGDGKWESTHERFGYHVYEHWNTAGFLLVRIEVLQEVRWGWDPIGGHSDDPWFARQVERAGFGPTLIRGDCVGDHEPLVELENRGLDRRLDR